MFARILILGGSGGANALAQALAARPGVEPILSLAGRTQSPRLPPVAHRIGGFGGISGLTDYLRAENIRLAVNAVHPFAAQMSAHAEAACAALRVPLLRLVPPAWARRAEDDWTEVADYAAAVDALGDAPARVFLTHGRLNLAPFAQAPQHFYLVRSIERPHDIALLARHELLLARGPFDLDAETRLLLAARIDVMVTKNSGGGATYAKIEAARALRLPVVMVRRPPAGAAPQVGGVEDALAWIAAHIASA